MLEGNAASGRKLSVNYLSKAQIKDKLVGAKDMEKFYLQCLEGIIDGQFIYDNTLGQLTVGQTASTWKGISVREFIQKWWA
jgi:hypothetical protein